jgi:hypothetical protein
MEVPVLPEEIKKPMRATELPEDILDAKKAWEDNYEETDIFAWTNNLVQYVDELKIELYLFNKNYILYRTKLAGEVARQLRPLFLDQIMEYVLGGAENGLVVRGFEEAEKEDNVLQRTRVKNVDKLVDVLNWMNTQTHETELFNEAEHELKKIKGVVAVCTHKDIGKPFFIVKSLPTSQIMSGHTAWMLKDGVFKPFDTMKAMKIPDDNQLLIVGQDLFVFNQARLKALFGYDAKAAVIAAKKVEEIEANFKLSFAEGVSMQSLIKGKPAAIKKLQKIEPSIVKQKDLIDHADEVGVDLMVDDSGAIIIMDDKDMTTFVNLLNDDYMESPMTGQRYEIIKKRLLKADEEAELMKEAGL